MNVSLRSVENFFQHFSLRQITLAWYRYFKLTFTVLFFVVVAYGGYVWYSSLYHYTWSDGEKKAFADKTFTETNLKEKEFSKLLEMLKKRTEDHQNPLTISRNIFTGEPAVNQ